jgi:uncharacterized protein involved in oxidation of intracellular sulfur
LDEKGNVETAPARRTATYLPPATFISNLMSWTIIVNDPPYGNEKTWNAFRLASTARSEGVDVRLFLMGDSVASAKTGQKTPEGFYNMEKMLIAMLNKGVEVKVCGTCINARGLDIPELVEGVGRGSMKILVDWIKNSDRVVTF